MAAAIENFVFAEQNHRNDYDSDQEKSSWENTIYKARLQTKRMLLDVELLASTRGSADATIMFTAV